MPITIIPDPSGIVTDATISISDITTNNVSNSAHGFMPKLTTANLKAFISAAGTTLEYGTGIYIGTFSRDESAGAGDVAYTGVGFKPSAAIFVSAGNTSWYNGLDNGTIHSAQGIYGAASYDGNGSKSIIFRNGAAQTLGLVKTFDSDGFTITWSKSGTPSGTVNVYYIAFR